MDKAAATYKGEVTMVDTWVGHLLRKVENMGIADDTMIVFTSDHGFYFGEHGGLFGQDDVRKTAGRQAVPTRRSGFEVGLLAAVRGV